MNLSNERDSWSDEEVPGLWPDYFNSEHCCIYRVPNHLRRGKPEAYTPQMLIIGPLHHSKKFDKTDSRYLDYINMERCKKKYLKETANTYGAETVDEFKRIIERDELIIRACYAESTDWIKSKEFVEMILRDSVFILQFLMRKPSLETLIWHGSARDTREVIFTQSCLLSIISTDLILLENQLPYFLLTELFEPFFIKLQSGETFRHKICDFFNCYTIKPEKKFRHFTDLILTDLVTELGMSEEQHGIDAAHRYIMQMHNADMLNCAGVNFKVNAGLPSLDIKFNDGVLTMSPFKLDEYKELGLRNMMALEQCHYFPSAIVCSYIGFLTFLIKSNEDVDLLVKKGIIENNYAGGQVSVKKTVDQLYEGILDFGSYYYDSIAKQLHQHSQKRTTTLRLNLSIATLRRVYFKDLWTGTASIAAAVILVLTLIGTVASVLQVTQKDNKSAPALAPTRGQP